MMASHVDSTKSSMASVPTAGLPGPEAGKSRRPRPQKPNYRHIHRFPLPISVHPLPPLIPHNPLSLISVALSYLTYLISPPYKEVYSAYFDSATSSVHVTDEKAVRALWEMGFFGKGSLSRSEPSWLEREKKRRGLLGENTNEEITGKRRLERRELKLERARMEKLAVEQRLKAEAAAKENGSVPTNEGILLPPADGAPNDAEKFSLRKAWEAKYLESRHSVEQEADTGTSPDLSKNSPSNGKAVRFSPVVQQEEFVSNSNGSPFAAVDGPVTYEEPLLENEEHLQLSNEETFFLVYGLGALQVFDDERNCVIPTSSLFPLFSRHSYFPPRDSATIDPDDPFVLSYVVYHHYRSLGWVVRSGVKFGVDYLLYNRGPVFSHAEFAVVVVPSYVHSYWSETGERRDRAASRQERSWWWLHGVNRVQAQVKKSLVICYVDVPPPAPFDSEIDIGEFLRRYKIRDISVKRWVPNRSRD